MGNFGCNICYYLLNERQVDVENVLDSGIIYNLRDSAHNSDFNMVCSKENKGEAKSFQSQLKGGYVFLVKNTLKKLVLITQFQTVFPLVHLYACTRVLLMKLLCCR